MRCNQEVCGGPGKRSVNLVWPSPRGFPTPPSLPPLLYGEATKIHTVVLLEGGVELMTEGQFRSGVHPLRDASHSSLFPSSPVQHQEVPGNISALGPNQKGQEERMRELLIGSGQSSSVTQILSGSFSFSVCFPDLPSLSVPLCVTFLLAPSPLCYH